MIKLLACRRVHYPKLVQHTFQHIYQAQAYWLEGHKWAGDQWTDKARTIHLREGESQFRDEDFDQAAAREFRGLLGELRGEIDGQQIRVHRKHVSALTVWIGDEMIDWDKPVVLKAGGREDFEGRVEPDLYVCLSQAARTRDFDRLHWAGLRIKRGTNTRLVTSETHFPALIGQRSPQKQSRSHRRKPSRLERGKDSNLSRAHLSTNRAAQPAACIRSVRQLLHRQSVTSQPTCGRSHDAGGFTNFALTTR